ncbi:MAG: DUF2178 domain-containing protein [Haloferacaceae archaeon]
MTASALAERRYRLTYAGVWALSGLVLAGALVAGYPLVGVAGFYAFALASVLVTRRHDGPLFDERDRRVSGAAAARTLRLFGVGAAVFFPVVTALVALGVTEWPSWLVPIALFVPVLYATYGLFAFVERR